MPDDSPELEETFRKFEQAKGALIFYAAPDVAFAMSRYLQEFERASSVLGPDSPPLHPAYQALAKAQNDLILEMRRDAFSWSLFSYHGKPRFTSTQSDHLTKDGLGSQR